AALNVVFIGVGLVATFVLNENSGSFLSSQWAPIGSNEFAAIGLLAMVILIGSVGTAIAYQIGRSSVIATFDFAYVGFAVLWGFLFFAEVPDAISVFGISLVVIAGIMAVRQGSS
ncbi:MAG: DMT family transporter, partial [Hyphomicrobiales bacterium]